MSTYFANKFKELRIKNNLTQEQIANKFNMSKTGISYWESAKSQPSIEMINELAKLFNVTVDELIQPNQDKPINPNYKNIPIYDCVSCGLGSFVDDEIIDYIPIPTSRLSSHYEYFAQTAKGDSMINKNIYDGDIIIFRKTVTLNNGDIGCFCVDDNNAICKVFQHDKSSNLVVLNAANENYSPIIITENVNFRILGKLEFILQDLKNRG